MWCWPYISPCYRWRNKNLREVKQLAHQYIQKLNKMWSLLSWRRQVFVEHLLCARWYAKKTTGVILYILLTALKICYTFSDLRLLSPFSKWGTERVRTLPKATQLLSGWPWRGKEQNGARLTEKDSSSNTSVWSWASCLTFLCPSILTWKMRI